MDRADFNQLYRSCRTFRRFKQDPLPIGLLEAALENARVVSSAANAQPLRYVAVTSPETLDAMQPLVAYAAKLPREIATPAPDQQPVAFIAISEEGNIGFEDVDLGLAAQAIISTCWSEGVGACMFGSIRIKSITELLQIPEEQKLRLVIGLGYPAHECVVEDAPHGATGDALAYRADTDFNFVVPKRPFEDIVRFA